jgi:ABC-type phosphate transport system substrate-binding protein
MLGPIALIAAILVSTAVDVRPLSSDRAFLVVVNQSNPVSSLTRAELSAIFMKRARSWRGGAEVLPVDQVTQSAIRERFSRSIHGKSVAYVTRYWQRLIFAGRGIPPPEAKSSAAVLDFVRAHHGAIGYIDSQTAVPDDVKVIEVRR